MECDFPRLPDDLVDDLEKASRGLHTVRYCESLHRVMNDEQRRHLNGKCGRVSRWYSQTVSKELEECGRPELIIDVEDRKKTKRGVSNNIKNEDFKAKEHLCSFTEEEMQCLLDKKDNSISGSSAAQRLHIRIHKTIHGKQWE